MSEYSEHDESISDAEKCEGNEEKQFRVEKRVKRNERKFECPQCGKLLMFKKAWLSKSSNSSISNYICIKCRKTFIHKSSPSKTTFVHSDEKKYKCKECGKVFLQKNNFMLHMLTHANENECNKCGKTLTWNHNDAKHIHLHTGDVKLNSDTTECRNVNTEGEDTENYISQLDDENLLSDEEQLKRDQEELKVIDVNIYKEQKIRIMSEDEINNKNKFHKHIPQHESSIDCQEDERKSTNIQHSDDDNIESYGKKYECYHCGKLFPQKSNLSAHILIHSDIKKYRCTLCDRTFSQEEQLNNHMLTQHSSEENQMCQKCGKKFTDSFFFNHHIHVHSDDSHFEYYEDGEEDKISDSNQHDFKHSGAVNVSFHNCSVSNAEIKEESSNSSINIKKKRARKAKRIRSARKWRRNYHCPECGITFQTKKDLLDHIHSDVRIYQCNVCEKRFSHKTNLKRHMIMHSGVKSHECEICGKGFYQKSNLKYHMTLHETGNNHECRKCGERFTLKSMLRKHKCGDSSAKSDESLQPETTDGKSIDVEEEPISQAIESEENKKHQSVLSISTDEKEKVEYSDPISIMKNDYSSEQIPRRKIHETYWCHLCGKKFSFKSSLTRHLMTHTGVKNYECGQCGKKFSQKSNLNQHMLIHRNKRNYECQRCGVSFSYRCALIEHVCEQIIFETNKRQELVRKHVEKSPLNQKDSRLSSVSSNRKMISSSAEEAALLDSSVSDLDVKEEVVMSVSESTKYQDTSFVYAGDIFHCPGCKKAFKSKNKLLEHTQNNDAIYECNECGKTFNRKSDLTRHYMLHTGVKKHTCEKCGKKFNQKCNLTQHMITHRKDWSYQCKSCGVNYSFLCGISKHVCCDISVESEEC